jgi:hypothetical protein
MKNPFDIQCPRCREAHDLYLFDTSDDTPRPSIRVRVSADDKTCSLLTEPGRWIPLTPLPYRDSAEQRLFLLRFILSLDARPFLLRGTCIWCPACGHEAPIEEFEGGLKTVESIERDEP